MLPLEKHFQRDFLKRIRKLKRSCFFKLNDATTIGLPDIIGTLNTFSIAIELKTKSKTTGTQRYNLTHLDHAGSLSLVVSPANADQAFSILERLSTLKPLRIAPTLGCEEGSLLAQSIEITSAK